VVHRPAVAAAADVVLAAPTLAPVLALAATGPERERLRGSAFRHLLDRGERALSGAARDARAHDLQTPP
jgi:hypothetical protein